MKADIRGTQGKKKKNSTESITAEIIHNGGKKQEFLVKFHDERYLMDTKIVQNTLKVQEHTINYH